MYVYIFENMLTHLNEHLFDGYFLWVYRFVYVQEVEKYFCSKKNEE